ncbi:MAG TPA: DoxX family protein [Pyrinomonadaceae bacterium]|nr:DoxX family protein [Pyrinomonadaceae bacterium]
MAVMLTVTGIAHFVITDQMVMMFPDFVPFKREIVYFTGICELAAVIGLIWTRFSRLTSVMLIIFFIVILPANIADALKGPEASGFGNGPAYLFIRIPEQILYLWWVWYFGLKLPRQKA